MARSEERIPAEDIESGGHHVEVPFLPSQHVNVNDNRNIPDRCTYCVARGLIAIILVYIFMATWIVADSHINVQARVLNFVVEVFIIFYCRRELMELFRSFCD